MKKYSVVYKKNNRRYGTVLKGPNITYIEKQLIAEKKIDCIESAYAF